MSVYEVPADIHNANDLESKLEHLKNIKRSFSVFRVDCGSCNGCEIEIFAAISPMWDPARFGFKLVANPRHADILVCSGPVTRQMLYPLLRAYEQAPDPKVVVAFGACGSTGGIFYDAYSVWGGVDKVIPVDVYIPGCPPHPASMIYGLAMAIGAIDQKLKTISHKEDNGMGAFVETSVLGNILFERDILAESKRLMSYIFGRKLFDKYITALKSCNNTKDASKAKQAIEAAMKNEDDPRYAECMGILHNSIYLKYTGASKEYAINIDDNVWNKV